MIRNIFADFHILDDSFQGSRTYLVGLYEEIVKSDSKHHFYFGVNSFNNLPPLLRDSGNVSFIKYRSQNRFFRLAVDIPLILKKYKIDIAHFQYILPLFKLSKEILTVHDVLFLDFPEFFPPRYRIRNRLLFGISARRADYLLTVSEYSKGRIARHFGIREDKIIITRNAVGADYYSGESAVTDVKQKYGLGEFILFVGRIEPRKNHLMLLQAFNELQLYKRNISLVFIGKRALATAEFDRYLDGLPVSSRDHVVFLENVPDAELQSFYQTCRLFVFPSFAEGFGIPPLEAYMSGASVLCSGSTAMSEYTFFGERLFNPGSLDELKQKIILFLDKPADAVDVKRVERYTGWKGSAESLFGIFDQNLLPVNNTGV